MRLVIASVSAALVLSGTPVFAKDTSTRVAISAKGIDFSSAEGVAEFRERAHVAIREACAAPTSVTVAIQPSQKCERDAMAQAMAKAQKQKDAQLALLKQ